MRRRQVISFLLVGLAVVVCTAAKEETIEAMKSRFETARPEDRPALAIQIAERQLHAADKLYIDGKAEEGRAAVGEVVAYCAKARDAATESKKHLKTVEIDVRKIADRLRDIKRTLAFEDQHPIEQAIRSLEDMRTQLLDEMFGKGNKKEKK
jgi:hypothetical protein